MSADDRWSVAATTRALLPILLVLTAFELVGGLTLGSFEVTLLRYPSLLVLVPVTIGTAGNLGSVLAARLSTALHLGLVSFEPSDEQLQGNAAAVVLLAVSVFPLVGAGAWTVGGPAAAERLPLSTVVGVALASGLALAALAVLVTVLATYVAYRAEADPDTVVIPVVTNVCDVLGVIVLFGVVELVVT